MVAISSRFVALSSLLMLVNAVPTINRRDSSIAVGKDSSYGGSYGGSSGNSSYGGSSGGSYGGSSGGSYGGSYGGSSSSSSSQYGGGYGGYASSAMVSSSSSMMMDSSSTMMMDSTSTTMMMDSTSTTMMMDSTSTTMMMDSTSTMMTDTPLATSTMAMSSSMPMYGSGGSSWGSSGYDSCVQQCVASYGAPPSMYTPPAMSGSYAQSGSGATHTVIVAPMKGVLRYVPFAVNASVGDTVRFVWGAGPHTVTKSSELEVCNKSSASPVFLSGMQNQGFVFDQVVNNTDPTFFYCGVPGHCEKGMFGIINPPNAAGANSSVAQMAPIMASNSSDMAAKVSYTMGKVSNDSIAMNWGNSLDMSQIPAEQMSNFMDNVMMTRLAMGQNPNLVVGTQLNANAAMAVPSDISNIKAGDSPASSSAPVNAAASASSTSSTAAAASSTAAKSAGSRTVVSSSGVVVAALLAGFFAL